MKDEKLPIIKEDLLPPPSLNPKQQDLCRKLDDFYEKNKFKPLRPKPSGIFAGAVYGMQSRLRSNPDWMSQVANSLRELLFPIWYEVRRLQNKVELIKDKFKKYGSVFIEDVFDEIEEVYGKLNDLAHHGIEPQKFSENDLQNFTENDFEKLVRRFEDLMFQSLTLTLDVFEQIDQLLLQKPEERDNQEKLKEEIRKLIKEKSSKEYFFYKTDERWLDWLWENGFLDAIKQKDKDLTGYGCRTPELNYLVRMADKKPEKVADIIIAVPVSKETFNPEVIDQFSHICGVLPAKQLARIVPKIRNDGWVKLMSIFNIWGFEYEKMFQILAAAKDYKSILTLAEAVLSVRAKEEIEQTSQGFLSDNPFYFNDISYTKVFKHLMSVEDNYAEKALELTTKVIGEIVLLGDIAESSEVFPIRETFYLYDVDFFSLKPSKEGHLSYRENIKELAVTIKVLTQRLIEKNFHEPEAVHDIYKKYIETLPESRAMWRLRLFVLSLCPEVFKDELKKAFFRLFEVKRYHELISGAEYEKALQKGFSVLSENDKRDYVRQVIEYFRRHTENKKEQDWPIRYGSRILSMIANQLTEEEERQAEEAGFKLDPSYEPMPSISPVQGGFVQPRGPITIEEFSKLSIIDIAKKLRTNWNPENLSRQYKIDDFLNPINAEGAGNMLRRDIAKRLQDYVKNAGLFFERGVLDEHYTYSFLLGIQEAMRADRSRSTSINWDKLIELLVAIKNSGEAESFDYRARERNIYNVWLASWSAVHSAMADVLYEMLAKHNGSAINLPKYRKEIFGVLRYLLFHPDPEPKDEELETAAIREKSSGGEKDLVSDPFTLAINSVRGKAFQAFVLFVYQDEKAVGVDEIRIAPDVKKLYEVVLKKEITRAIMFMFGHYLPSFYFRDREWILQLLPYIFPEESEKKHLYLAAWEGYLTNNIYEVMFFEPAFQELYKRGLFLAGDEDSTREYFKKPDEGITAHLALAFVVYHKKFDFEHPLFQGLWKQNLERQAKFINFIGRMFVSGDNAQINELLKKDSECRERLKKFWDWMLNNYDDPKLFAEFGIWINLEKEIFEPVWLTQRVKETLEKSRGILAWDYGLTKSILEMAKVAPKETLEIIRLYLLEGGVRSGKMRMPFIYDNEWFEAIKILYGNPETKDGTYALINDLIREGGSVFWKFKDILNDKKA